jgi:hypothetical protein
MSNERNYQGIGHAPFMPRGGLLANLATNEFGIALGTEIRDNRGNIFRFIKAAEAIAEGDALTCVAEAAWDATIVVDGAGAAGDTKLHVDTVTTAVAANYYSGYYITMATAASKGKSYRIKGHGALAAAGEGDIFLSDPLSEVYADDGTLLIYHPFLYELVDADTEIIKAVAIGTITALYYGWVQVGGYFQAVKVGHSTSAAIVINEPLVPVAANPGAVQGMAGGDEADIMEAVASQLISLRAVAANTTGFTAAYSKGIL